MHTAKGHDTTTELHYELFADSNKLKLPDNNNGGLLPPIEEDNEGTAEHSNSESSRGDDDSGHGSGRESSRVHTTAPPPLNLGNGAANKPSDEKSLGLRKMECLAKLMHIKSTGIELTRNYTMSSSLEDMEAEIKFHTDMQNKANSIKLSKSILLNAVTAIEFLNDNYDPFGFKLQGWSEQMRMNVSDFDDVFGELYEKYKGSGRRMEPEVKLVLMLVASAASFHASKEIMASSSGMKDLLQANPALLQKVTSSINHSISGPSEQEETAARERQAYEQVQRAKQQAEMQAEMKRQQHFMQQQMALQLKSMQNEIEQLRRKAGSSPSVDAEEAVSSRSNAVSKGQSGRLGSILDIIKEQNAVGSDDTTESASTTRIDIGDSVDSDSMRGSDIRLSRGKRGNKLILQA